MVDISVNLDAYAGPLDLLYQLIEKNEINIYDIPIAKLTDQYIEVVSALPPDMESLSLFLVMAATLLEIKSKMLLPSKVVDNEEEIDPREELVRRLLEYKKFKEISEVLRSKGSDTHSAIYKGMDQSIQELLTAPDPEMSELLEDISPELLLNIFMDVLNRKELKVDRIRSSFSSVRRDTFTIEEKIEHLKSMLKLKKQVRFHDFFDGSADKIEVVVTFLALLELIKQKEAMVRQSKVFGDIVVEMRL